MGAALAGFIDEDGYRALDALNELRESYGFRHREGHMHGLRLAPVEGWRGRTRPAPGPGPRPRGAPDSNSATFRPKLRPA
jgi:hypothetical protein